MRITGSNFKQGLQVTFGGVPALSTEYYGSDMVLSYAPPELPPGSYPVRLQNPGGAAAATASRPVELFQPPPRPTVTVVMACAFTDLTGAEADLLESISSPAGEGSAAQDPRIVRVLKRGPMSALSSNPTPDQRGKEYVIADIALLGEVAEISGGKRYFYNNQPLLSEFPVRLSLNGHPFTAVVHREPDPNRPEMRIRSG